MTIPTLEPHCGSWVCTSPDGRTVREFFEPANARRAAAGGWKVETAAQYLGRVNAAVRAGSWGSAVLSAGAL